MEPRLPRQIFNRRLLLGRPEGRYLAAISIEQGFKRAVVRKANTHLQRENGQSARQKRQIAAIATLPKTGRSAGRCQMECNCG